MDENETRGDSSEDRNSHARERPRPSEDFIPFLSWLPWSRACA